MNSIYSVKNFKLSVFIWLSVLSLLVFAIIIVGGLTRLTNSGLSMVNWQPILGTIPPLNNEEWINVFDLYKKTPEFLYINSNISLNEFKYIFWWEWSHRFIARFIGIIFIFPMIFFLIKKNINIFLLKRLVIIFIFGIIQALVGWWMVKSGLTDNPYVSAYRLTFHLINALLILSILLWTTMDYYYEDFKKNNSAYTKNDIAVTICIVLTFITIISGGFMAGTHAGQSFNTYPLMNGKIIPDDYYLEYLGYLNFFENIVAINFNHRWIATFTFLFVFSFFSYLFLKRNYTISKITIALVIIILIIQFLLGILTLLSNVNISFASLHQTNSVILLASLIYTKHQLKIIKINKTQINLF